ncbi:hypothetical protein IFM89_023079 [Coptis chinensis]|uniref:Uncharacterized protein n=1 Tax=Coptis chinensis TaxID=261450 RepID=A0A835IGR0_9MAGN|nr:hypothetical protein IFM89_023079 [Coptis chinensis]
MTSNQTKDTSGAEVLAIAPPEGGSDGYQNIRPLHGRTSGPTRRSTKGQWTAEEDTLLCRAVQRFKGRNWKKIAECFKDRTDVQCLHRWQKVLNPELVKGPWSKEEDDIIVEMVNKYGAKKWSTIAQALPGRIGKQCRERWHNHLNPAINKDAWTQEEELTLIRAHQLYGNKWAELTKFLPGRTDNSIKNHWNSSVKKKLDSYLASGLLTQFHAPPNVINQNICISSSSRMQQSSRENSSLQDGTETEEISECSQSSSAAGCSQIDYAIPNVVPVHAREEYDRSEDIQRKGQSSNSSSFSKQYYSALDDVTRVVPEAQCGTANSFHSCENHPSCEAGSSGNDGSSLCRSHDLPDSSAIELVHETSDLLETSKHRRVGTDGNQEPKSVPFQSSVGFNAPMGNSTMQPQNQELLCITEGDCRAVILSEGGTNVCFSLGNMTQSDLNSMEQCTDSSIYQSVFQSCETTGVLPLNCYYPQGSSDGLRTSSCQNLFANSTVVSPNDAKLIFGGQYDGVRDMYNGNQDPCDDFAYPCDSMIPYCDNNVEKVCLPMEPDQANDALNSELVENFSSVSLEADGIACSVNESTPVKTHQPDSEALFYEPPRFPSLELPFFSCDLIPSGSDLQQAYSPLGIRQLMSSMNCSNASIWDSPSRDDSPNLFLKSAAKSFICTPSILKKRQRELLSPVQEQKIDKKLERDISQGFYCTSMGIRSDFSSLDAIFDEIGTCAASVSSIEGTLLSPSYQQKKKFGASIHDKENYDHSGTMSTERNTSETAVDSVIPRDKMKQECNDVDAIAKIAENAATPTVQRSSVVLIEQDVNALRFFSPDRDGYPTNRTLSVGARTPRDQLREITLCRSGPSCSESSTGTVLISPRNTEKKHNFDLVPVSFVRCDPSSNSLLSTSENAGNNADTENFLLYGHTPILKRGFDSPSAWKSPWFANSFLPGPRIDTDITIEDMGYYTSPRDASYDALSLMRQLSEQSAAALAEAHEVLAGENPEVSLKEQHSEPTCLAKENNLFSINELESKKHLPTDVLNERRVLDFSGCGTPGKGSENKRSSGIASAVSFSSPSSYLMKGCR